MKHLSIPSLLLLAGLCAAPSPLAAQAPGAPALDAPVSDAPADAQSSKAQALRDAVSAYRQAHEVQIVDELLGLLEIPNVASDEVNIRRNAEHLIGLLEKRGLAARLLESPGSPPAVLAELSVGAEKTVVFYAHYDGQPVVPEQWSSDPWRPILRDGSLDDGARQVTWPPSPSTSSPGPINPEWRIYGRAASDDKGPIVAMLRALDALNSAGVTPSVNLKFFFEGEEEVGSPHLRAMLETHRDALNADLWLFCDGPIHQSRRGQVVFGVRGITGGEFTVYGAKRPLHSGHYGNWAPNPGARIAELITALRAPDGTILVDGLEQGLRPISDAERAALKTVPPVDEGLLRELGLAASEAENASLTESLMRPALNVRGIAVGAVGERSRNVISTEATASLGIRLVPDQQPEDVHRLVEAQLERLGWKVIHQEPTAAQKLEHDRLVRIAWKGGYPALRTALDLPLSKAVIQAVEEGRGEEVVVVPTMGGSLPLYLFDEILRTPLIITPMANHDNNQHGKDENLRLENLWRGIEMYASLMARLGELW